MEHVAEGSAAVLLVAVAVLLAEVMWTVHRRLPPSIGLDASGHVRGRVSGPPLRLVVLGDSTSTGPGLDDPAQIWFRRAIAELDLPRPVEVVSLAVGGSRVSDVLQRVEDAIAARPDLVLVAVGSNDVIHGTLLRRFEVQLDQLLGNLGSLLPVVAVANVGDLGNIARIPPPLSSVLRARSRSFSRTIERVVRSHTHAILLDVTLSDSGFRDVAVFGPDLFHPNAKGHSLWATAVASSMREMFAALDASTEI